jgi:hypothetical protein
MQIYDNKSGKETDENMNKDKNEITEKSKTCSVK